MSSIFGILNKSNSIENQKLQNMQEKLNYWNADASGLWQSNRVGLGHLMLQNSFESQNELLPFHCNRSGLAITADARIDNREELMQMLNISYIQQDQIISDSTLILKAYEKYGENCVDYLIGDFAFAIWDDKTEKLFLARDHMGIRPLYYYEDDNFFAFSSEIKGLLAIGINEDVNNKYLKYLLIGLQTKEDTCYNCVKRLCASQCLVVQKGYTTVRKYWELSTTKETVFKDPAQYAIRFYELLEQAVKCRIRSAFPVGFEVSGGMDSTSIACIGAKLIHNEGKSTYGVAFQRPAEFEFPEITNKESFYIEEVRKFAPIDHLEVYTDGDYSKDSLEEIKLNLERNDGPCAYMDIGFLYMKQLAQKHQIRCLLSGFLGDQMATWWNDAPYYLEYLSKYKLAKYFKEAWKMNQVTYATKLLLGVVLQKIFPKSVSYLTRKRRSHLLKKHPNNLLLPEYFNEIAKTVEYDYFSIPSSFREIQIKEVTNEILSQRMEGEIRSTKAMKMELAYPMADIRLIEYVLSIPVEHKVSAQNRRKLFRLAMAEKIPVSILNNHIKMAIPIRNTTKKWMTRSENIRKWINDLSNLNVILPYLNISLFKEAYKITSLEELEKRIVYMEPRTKRVAESIIMWKVKKNS
jgi:asparagine synthase (glutamine-hydrolysing)